MVTDQNADEASLTDETTNNTQSKQTGQTINPKQMRRAEELRLIMEDDNSKVAQALHIARILHANGVNLRKIQLSKKTNGKRHFFLLSEIQQDGIDIEQIIKENNLDGTFAFGRTVTVIRERYSARKRKQENADNLSSDNSGNKSKKRENNGYKIEGDELDEAFDLGLIPLPAKTIVAQTLEIARILKKHNVDFSKIEFRMRYKNGEPVGLLLEEIQQDGIDIKGIIQKYNLNGKFDFVKRVLDLREAYTMLKAGIKSNSKGCVIKPEEAKEAELLGLISDKEMKLQGAKKARDAAKALNTAAREKDNELDEVGIKNEE